MFFFSVLLPYTALVSTVCPLLPGPEDLDSLHLNTNSVATGVHLDMAHQVPTEQSHPQGFELSPIVIPGAENMDKETVEAFKALFNQAGEDNASLEPEERAFFLLREDVFGLAVALPGLLTEDQRNWIMGRLPPKIVKEAIRKEYNVDSLAKMVNFVNDNVNDLTERQFRLLLRNFHPIEDNFDYTGGTLFASLASPIALSTDGFVRAASNNLKLLDGTAPAIRKAGLVYYSPERRQARLEKSLQRRSELESASAEEKQARNRDAIEKRAARRAGAAARQERLAEISRWGEASSKLSDAQLAEMRRLRELGPEAVQQRYLEGLGLIQDVESDTNSKYTDE